MIRFAFRKGMVFLQGLKALTLLRVTPTRKLQFETEEGELLNIDQNELHRRWLANELVIDERSLSPTSNVIYLATPKDLSCFGAKDQQIAIRKQEYVRAVADLLEQDDVKFFSQKSDVVKNAIAAVALRIDDPKPPSIQVVHLWLQKYNRTKCVTKLIDGRSRSGRSHDPQQRSIFEEAVNEVYLTAQKLKKLRVFETVQKKIKRLNSGVEQSVERVVVPSRATIYRWLNDLQHSLTLLNRSGKRAAEKELRAALKTLKVERVLERYEIDHTPVNLICICKHTNLILGRPWITIAIDRKSRAIVGYYISFHAPSAYSVLHCLKAAIFPKTEVLQRYEDIHNEWPCFGIPELVAVDNGAELHSFDVEREAHDLGIEILLCPAGEPQCKGAIERFMRTIAEDLFHELPGTTFSCPQERGDYPSEKRAAIDLETLDRLVVKWIVDIYNQTPHRGLQGRKPVDVWNKEVQNRLVELPAYPLQLANIVAHSAVRSLFHYGVEVENLRYNSPELQVIRARREETQKLFVKFYEDSVDNVSVLDPDNGIYINVPAVEIDYATGLHRNVHRLVCAEARLRFTDDWTNANLIAMREEMQQIVDAAIKSKKVAERKQNAVVRGVNSANAGTIGDPFAPATQIHRKVEELDPGLDDHLPHYDSSNADDDRKAA